MEGDDSFDPQSWVRTTNPRPAPHAPADALPEAWREVAAAVPGQQAIPGDRRGSAHLLPPAVSLVILCAGAAVALMLPGPPRPTTPVMPEAVAASEGTAGVSTRRLVLANAGDIRDALVSAGVAGQQADSVTQALLGAMPENGEIRTILELRQVDGGVELVRLDASYADGSGAVVTPGADGRFNATHVAAELSRQIRVVSGELDAESFYSSAVTAGVTDTLIPEFINAFTFDFNLAAEVKAGDTFEVAYEQTVNANGNPVGQPQLIYASLTTPTKSRALYRFKPEGQEVGWFDGNGASTVRSFMRTPVDGARITSNFGMRFHPVLHYTRLHAGVDFGVPVGTPVYTAADGVVTGATPTGCGGNMAVVQHDNGWVTRYFHLSQYAPGLHTGQRVAQGFTIGLSGTTGTCTTGPHLHYELRIDGQPVDPMSVQTDAGRKALEGGVLAAFKRVRDRVDVARAQQVR